MRLVNRPIRRKRALKISKTGMEAEFHIIDDRGMISNRADEVIAALKGLREGVNVMKEIGRSMIEFGSYPGVKTYTPALDMIDSLKKTFEVCRSNELWIFPFGTYPGRFKPLINKKPRYPIQQKIIGKERFKISPTVTGFHHHYSLPKGVFDHKKKVLKELKKSKTKRTMVSSYNFEIAADPALTLFTQSTPFYQGEYIGKDSRIIVYRGGKKLRNMEAVYAKLQQFGGLPPYKQTETDLISSLHKRWVRWEKEVKKVTRLNFNELWKYKLDISWNPVKINKHGTLEQRGMDVNFMSILVAVTVLLKFSLKKIQREFIEVIPADFGVEEAFKLEDGILYVPPHTYVRNKLQYWSAYKGYDKKDMHHYAKRFFNFARSVAPKKYSKIIKPIYDMIDSKKSVSDKILSYAKYKGYYDNGKISNKDAAQLSLYYAEQFPKDLAEIEKYLGEV